MGILCAAFLSSIVTAIGGEGQGARKLICGVFLALALLHPLGSLDLPEVSLTPFLRDAEEAVRDGRSQTLAAQNDIITDSLEAYILTKAAELGLELDAEVTLNAESLPASVTLTGRASPSEQEVLINSLCAALGLGKEEIRWKEIYQSSE